MENYYYYSTYLHLAFFYFFVLYFFFFTVLTDSKEPSRSKDEFVINVIDTQSFSSHYQSKNINFLFKPTKVFILN